MHVRVCVCERRDGLVFSILVSALITRFKPERERERETKQENKQDYHLKMARWREKAKDNQVSLLFQHLTPHASCF